MLLLWNALILLLWPVLYFYTPFRDTMRARLGYFELGGYNPRAPGLKVLVNAVSAGEVVAIAPFIRELKLAQPDAQVVLLTTTESGQTMARGKLGGEVDLLAYFPLIDLPFVARRYLDYLAPDLYITTESELWPNIMHRCQRRGIPVALVNARLYLHNKGGWRGRVVRRLYDFIDLIVCQDEKHRDNFLKFGLPHGRLSVSGNTKFDFALPEWSAAQLAATRKHYGTAGCLVITAGSTHPGEEELLLDALRATRSAHDDGEPPRLILAPRHIERAGDTATLARERGYTAVTLSDYMPGASWDVLVVDRYGVLTDMYRLADIVVMGGTFHPKVGGHNILEATALGKPVIIGPHTYSITAQVELLASVDGLHACASGEELAAHMLALAGDRERCAQIGAAALRATLAQRGAAKRAVEQVLTLFSE